MEINHIFGNLYAFKFEGEDMNEYYKAFDNWTNPMDLKIFFESQERDLFNGFYSGISVNDAVIKTVDEAYDFEELIEKITTDGNLESVFKDLEKKQFQHQKIYKKKAYGVETHSWLRLYAIKIEGLFLITGSSIKLTKTMNERAHTKKELNKIEQCKAFLKEQGAWDTEAIKEMES